MGRLYGITAAVCFSLTAVTALAQQGPVGAMFAADQKRDAALAASFQTLDVPPSKTAAFPLRVYLSAGDLERAFDRTEFRPDAAIVPTNTDLLISGSAPATQRVLIDRVRKQPETLRGLEEQIAARRKRPSAAAGKETGVLRVGIDTFVAQLAGTGAFPKTVCLVATDYADGGAIDHRQLFAQDRVRKGIADCLAALDAAGARSVVLPLLGAASSGTQANDPMFEGQRVLQECRLINSAAGIALGLHDFVPGRNSLREIGIVQWDREIAGMFTSPGGRGFTPNAEKAYRAFAAQISQAVRKGLAGTKTTASDVDGSCNPIFSVQ